MSCGEPRRILSFGGGVQSHALWRCSARGATPAPSRTRSASAIPATSGRKSMPSSSASPSRIARGIAPRGGRGDLPVTWRLVRHGRVARRPDVRERVDRVPRYRPPPCWTLCWPACRATCSQCAHLQVLRRLSQDRSPVASCGRTPGVSGLAHDSGGSGPS
jgi:hypothetical protein